MVFFSRFLPRIFLIVQNHLTRHTTLTNRRAPFLTRFIATDSFDSLVRPGSVSLFAEPCVFFSGTGRGGRARSSASCIATAKPHPVAASDDRRKERHMCWRCERKAETRWIPCNGVTSTGIPLARFTALDFLFFILGFLVGTSSKKRFMSKRMRNNGTAPRDIGRPAYLP